MAVVLLDIEEFRKCYPAFTDETQYSDEMIEMFFSQAEEIIGNTDANSLVPYEPTATPPVKTRKTVLYATTCHLISMLSGQSATSPNMVVTSASEGSVSVGYSMMMNTSKLSAQWWNMSRCGALAYLMLRKYMLGGRLFTKRSYHPYG